MHIRQSRRETAIGTRFSNSDHHSFLLTFSWSRTSLNLHFIIHISSHLYGVNMLYSW
jgi:hypothetical protein